MKILKLSIITFVLLATFSFTIHDKAFESNLLQIGESISFSNKPKHEKELSSSSLKKGAYDGSGFDLEIDRGHNILIRDITQSNGPKQDELIVVGCTGNLTRSKDNVIFKFEKCRGKYYIIDLNNSKLIDSFDSIIQLSLSSSDLKGNPAEFYCSQKDKSAVQYRRTSNPNAMKEQIDEKPPIRIINLISVPADMKQEDLYKEVHKESTLAHFSNIELVTSTNRKVSLPSGSYILCEGNSFSME